jgi:hypothetical protein
MESSSYATIGPDAINDLITQRSVLRKRKCYEEADQIGSSLRSQDIIISDNADGTTTWEIKKVTEIVPKEDRPPRTSARYRKMQQKNLRRKAVKSRGRDFAKWVMHQFNDFLTEECTTILDIAGGKGEVSYYIASHLLQREESSSSSSSSLPPHRCCCTIIDPMPVSLSRQKTKDLIRKNTHHAYVSKGSCNHQSVSNIVATDATSRTTSTHNTANTASFEEWFQANETVVSRMPSYAGHFQPIEHFQLAMHLNADKRVLWLDRLSMLDEGEREFGIEKSDGVPSESKSNRDDDDSINGDVKVTANSDINEEEMCSCNQISVPMIACQAARAALCSLDELNIQHIQDYFNEDLIKSKLSYVLGHSNRGPTTFLLGFHPDEPTADIVDMALRYSMPFVVVPCCVFPSKFSSRVLKNGAAVRSFEDFILFLKEKDARIHECTIDVLLKPNNIALYMRSSDFAQ